MPPLFFVMMTIIWLAAPLYGITLILFDTHHRPHHRNILALGGGVLLNAAILTTLAFFGLLLDGTLTHILPLLVIWGAAFAAWQLLNTQSLYR